MQQDSHRSLVSSSDIEDGSLSIGGFKQNPVNIYGSSFYEAKELIVQNLTIDQTEIVAGWYSPIEHGLIHRKIFEKRAPETGSWFLESEEYQSWAGESEDRILWCPGTPGVGKSSIASLVVQNLRQRGQGHAATGCIFFNHLARAEQNLNSVLGSICRQVFEILASATISDAPSPGNPLQDLYRRHQQTRSRPSTEELSCTLSSTLQGFPRCYLIVDALDEYRENSEDYLLEKLFDLLLGLSQNLKILVTSRPVGNLDTLFGRLHAIKRSIVSTDLDIGRFLKWKIEMGIFCFRVSDTLEAEIINGVQGASLQMFSLTVLHLDFLANLLTLGEVRDALRNLHNEPDIPYTYIMDRINSQNQKRRELAMQILLWVACFSRPLHISELQYTLAIQPKIGGGPVSDYVMEAPVITAICAGLVSVDESTGIVSFTHPPMEGFFHKHHQAIFPEARTIIKERVAVLKESGVAFTSFDDSDDEDEFCSPVSESGHEELNPSNTIQAIGWFRTLLSDKERYQRLLNLESDSAQSIVDILQELLDSKDLTETTLRKKIIVALQKLATREGPGVFPSSCEINETKDDIVPEYNNYMGSGGFGDIYKCALGGRLVCVKVIRLFWVSQGEKFVKQFIKEGILWAQLSHRNVVPFQGFFRYQKRPCLTSPWLNNGHVVEFLKANPSVNRYLLVRDITNGLNYLHSWGIVHGDLKSANALVDDCGRACLSDFGISSVLDATLPHWSSQSTVASKGGSIRWQAPELLNNTDDSDVQNTIATDVYAWACVCYEIFTERLPFYEVVRDATIIIRVGYEGIHPSRPSEDSPSWASWGLQQPFWELMENCWAKGPGERPPVEKLLAAPQLAQALDKRINDAQPESASQYRASKRLQRDFPSTKDLERLFTGDAER